MTKKKTNLERDRCDGCGRFHQDLSYDEDSGLALCDDCITKKYGPADEAKGSHA